MRLFTAIELPQAVRDRLVGAQASLRPTLSGKIAWTAAANLHVTLKFLGEIPDSQVRAICETLRGVPVRPMMLSLARLGVLPARGLARVLMAELAGDVALLTELFESIEQACVPLGFAPENRPFRPHITLARLRQPRRIDREIASVTLDPIPFEAREFVLMQSILGRAEPVYSKLTGFACFEPLR